MIRLLKYMKMELTRVYLPVISIDWFSPAILAICPPAHLPILSSTRLSMIIISSIDQNAFSYDTRKPSHHFIDILNGNPVPFLLKNKPHLW